VAPKATATGSKCAVAQKNVQVTMEKIRAKSPIIAGLETEGKVIIVGALYNLKTGEVEFLD
jgi:carbonic anhydrase